MVPSQRPDMGEQFVWHANSPVLALDHLALMTIGAATRLTRADVLEYAARTIDLIIPVGREGGRRGVEEIYLPALERG